MAQRRSERMGVEFEAMRPSGIWLGVETEDCSKSKVSPPTSSHLCNVFPCSRWIAIKFLPKCSMILLSKYVAMMEWSSYGSTRHRSELKACDCDLCLHFWGQSVTSTQAPHRGEPVPSHQMSERNWRWCSKLPYPEEHSTEVPGKKLSKVGRNKGRQRSSTGQTHARLRSSTGQTHAHLSDFFLCHVWTAYDRVGNRTNPKFECLSSYFSVCICAN